MQPLDDTIISFEAAATLRDLVIREPQETAGAYTHPIDTELFHIRMASTAGKREAASLLLRKMYGWRGYDVDAETAHVPNRITLYAETRGATVGTMSLCLDDPALGLPADENFRDKLDELRGQARRLCEPSRLAIDKDVSKRVFAALIHISYIYAHNIHGYTDYVIEVNPRHVMFYKRMLGFRDFGGERPCSRVGAPAVLLRLELERMGEQIRRFGGQMEQAPGERSFYPYFFPLRDEPGITGRLIQGHD
ncbi:N-acyl amino acid synthase FeeM domain-containing protein [Pseudoduganella chitinolytica]|uniref:Long-chain N-acyl amino acid synthase n=1 Tax=Pseudoduganella chitinolytica TaxID=34070 RepID=A0ABY8BIQ3_9BURK|nr:long-chain N-acyl amino acid synthase [Pseudoduganella chitinolytica]WEF34552.1 long-chain N-acyl amino acid synthase [Pseudoduganella chitinolytica]